MRPPSLNLEEPVAKRRELLALAEQVPGAWVGMKIAALLLIVEGQRPGWIAEVLGLTRMSLCRWIHSVNEQGVRTLVPQPKPGRPAALKGKVRNELEAHLERSPQEFGLNRAQWDGPTLVVHLKRRFGISLKVRQAQIWMHQLGYRMKRASHAYLQARSEDARRFQRALKKLRNLKRNETVVFQDETGFTLHPRLGFGWARRGQRLRVPTTSQHNARLNLSGWVAPLLGRYGMIRTEQGNREGFLGVLRHLYRHLQRYRITLYVDGAGWHKGESVRQFLRTHPRLRLCYLPPYQPALNMQERIWRRVRYEATTNRWFDALDTIWDTVQRTTRAWTPQKVHRLCNVT